MKTMALLATVILATATAFAQGTVNFNNNIPGVLVTHVYWGFGMGKWGPGPNDTPYGNQDYSGWELAEGAKWSAQLWGAEGLYLPPAALRPAYPMTTFRTGTEAGFLEPVTATLTGVPADAQFATVQLRVWDTEGGRIPDWDTAVLTDCVRGASPIFNVIDIGGVVNPPPNLIGLQSFTAYTILIPEPASLSLAGLGSLVFLAWRRKR